MFYILWLRQLCYCVVSILLFINIALAQENLIRDAEIENLLDSLSLPLFKKAGLKASKIYVIHDDIINAFTDGKDIFITSGLMIEFPEVDTLRAVIAHEIGHVYGKHRFKAQTNIENAQKLSIGYVAIGALLGAIAKSPELMQAGIIGGMGYSYNSYICYSKELESMADQTALKILEKNGYTAAGLVKLFEYLHSNEKSHLTGYYMTHPLTTERIVQAKSFLSSSKYQKLEFGTNLQKKISHVIAKLDAFTSEMSNLTNKYQNDNLDDIYAQAIIFYRKGDLNKSLKYINQLIDAYPENGYYHELKGQILFNFGKTDALSSYKKSINLLPKEDLIIIEKIIADLGLSKHPSESIEKELKLMIAEDSHNIFLWRLLLHYYDKISSNDKKLFALSKIEYQIGNYKKSVSLAKKAIKNFAKDTSEWYQLQDIILSDK